MEITQIQYQTAEAYLSNCIAFVANNLKITREQAETLVLAVATQKWEDLDDVE